MSRIEYELPRVECEKCILTSCSHVRDVTLRGEDQSHGATAGSDSSEHGMCRIGFCRRHVDHIDGALWVLWRFWVPFGLAFRGPVVGVVHKLARAIQVFLISRESDGDGAVANRDAANH